MSIDVDSNVAVFYMTSQIYFTRENLVNATQEPLTIEVGSWPYGHLSILMINQCMNVFLTQVRFC